MVGRIRSRILQVLRSDEAVELQEEPEDRAALQQVRGAQGRVENLQNPETKKLDFSLLWFAQLISLSKAAA